MSGKKMSITPTKITIREIVENYEDLGDDGVNGLNHRLNIRPQYQREFIYKDKERNAVVETIMSGFPLNTMYWCKSDDPDFDYEIMDGQQRTISFCQYVNNEFSINQYFFQNLTPEEQNSFLDYEVQVYVCDGTHKEKLKWFETINIAGIQLAKQELRNAIYAGPWVSAARAKFSKKNCVAERMGSKYLKGDVKRQDYLETAIKWLANAEEIGKEDVVNEYMGKQQFVDNDAHELWLYFRNVIGWVEELFSQYRSCMKGIEWGYLYNKYKDNTYNPKELEEKIKQLLLDDEVQSPKGIYLYLFDGNEKHLQLRQFTDKKLKLEKYEEQHHKCNMCGKEFPIGQMDMDHIVQWRKGGKTVPENCQLLCTHCNRGPKK